MLKEFTERARRVLGGARGEAKRLGSACVRTEHILLSLCRDPESTAARTLAGLGEDLDVHAVANEAGRHLVPEAHRTSDDEIPFAPCAKRVVELAIEASHHFDHEYVGTAHLLLGLHKEGEGLAARVLRDFEIDWDRLQTEVLRLTQDDGR